MNIHQYSENHQNVKPNASIQQRWNERVAGQGLHLMGRAGGDAYLANYGRGISASKCVALARMADVSGFPLVGARFWEEAFFLETGAREVLIVAGGTAPTPSVALAPVTLKEQFGQLPQLLTALTREDAFALLADPNIGVQEKKDGERTMTRTTGGVSAGGNKKGFKRRLPDPVASALGELGNGERDGELVAADVTLWLFDVLKSGDRDLRNLPLRDRYAALKAEFAAKKPEVVGTALRLIPLISGDLALKLAHVLELEAQAAEGFVLKRLDAPYTPGESHKQQWKFQFRARAAVIAGDQNGSKNSIEVFVRREVGELRSMGSVTIPTNAKMPAKGQIIEVEYLYVHPGGCFAQPVYKGLRDDVDEEDCVESKLKVKAA